MPCFVQQILVKDIISSELYQYMYSLDSGLDFCVHKACLNRISVLLLL